MGKENYTVTKKINLRKLLIFTVVLALGSLFTVKADWVKNPPLAVHDFLDGVSPFTTEKSVLSGNNVGIPGVRDGYLFATASGSGNRGTKITNMTEVVDRTDTVYYEFDWNPYQIGGQANSTGSDGANPEQYGVAIVRGANDSIVFGLWYERWSYLAGSKYNTDSVNAEPLGDIHLMNISTDPYNPVPAQVVTRNVGGADVSYYTNTLIPFAMLEPGTSTHYAAKCDSINKSTDLGPSFKMNRWYRVKASIDFKNKRIISFEIIEKENPDNKKSFTDLPFVNTGANDVSRLEIATTRGKREGTTSGSTANYEQRFDNFDIYTLREVAVSSSVVVSYVDESGTSLKPSRTVLYLELGTEFEASAADLVPIYIGEEIYIYDETSTSKITLQGGVNEMVLKFKKATPKAALLTITAPSTAELYKDVQFDIAVKTPDNDPVGMGYVLFYVNNIAKNRLELDVLGTASVVMPNLLVGDANIAAVYVGDRINYAHSDTAKTVVAITPSTASVKPYPVYFDLVDQPEIAAWDRERGMTTDTPRDYSKTFRCDSLAGIVVTEDTLSEHRVGYYYAGSTYDKIDNAYNRADFVTVPLGSSRPTYVKFKTPWLNEGSYNIYLSHRVSGDPKTNMTTIDMNGKELYFPNEEMYGRWFKSWMGVNNRRRWNTTGHSGSMGMNYLGSVSVDKSGTQSLTINVLPENGATYNLDMLQFIPVDMDSLDINLPAAESMGKNYFPMFDWLGFAHFSTEEATMTTFADFTEFAVPYQVADQTDYQKYAFTINDLGMTSVEDMVADYCIVYRKEDKWTRVAEGAIMANSFTGELPAGDYYYQEINYIDMGTPGAAGYRTFFGEGYFSVGESGVNDLPVRPEVYAYSVSDNLLVKGFNAGDRVVIYDVAGKLIANEIATSDSFEKSLKPSLYIVKVLSAQKGTHVMKVIVK
ncbi:MAG: hypothetical protein PHU68_00260 [Paludibacter sp.]|nr:hypothetical protein [Paludibacter sp.]